MGFGAIEKGAGMGRLSCLVRELTDRHGGGHWRVQSGVHYSPVGRHGEQLHLTKCAG